MKKISILFTIFFITLSMTFAEDEEFSFTYEDELILNCYCFNEMDKNKLYDFMLRKGIEKEAAEYISDDIINKPIEEFEEVTEVELEVKDKLNTYKYVFIFPKIEEPLYGSAFSLLTTIVNEKYMNAFSLYITEELLEKFMNDFRDAIIEGIAESLLDIQGLEF